MTAPIVVLAVAVVAAIVVIVAGSSWAIVWPWRETKGLGQQRQCGTVYHRRYRSEFKSLEKSSRILPHIASGLPIRVYII